MPKREAPVREFLEADPILALARPGILRDPYPAYAWLREHRPVFWHEPLESWMLTRHADCVAVLGDSTRFAADRRRAGEETPPRAASVRTLDPPVHTEIRRLLTEALRNQDITAVERMIAERTRELLTRLARRSPVDFGAEFAHPLALSTITGLLGVPTPDVAWFVPIADAITDGMDAGLWPERAESAMKARAELAELTDGWLTGPRRPGVVGVVAEQAVRSGIDRTVIANTLRVLLHAGYTSAGRLLTLSVAALLDLPDGLGALRRTADPGRAVEELVRYTSPVQAMARTCVAEATFSDATVRAGEAVTLLLGAANRDPERFDDPERVRLDRHPNPHLGFGRGARFCLGSSFATLQARTALSLLVEHHPAARRAGPLTYRRNLTMRGLDRFEITLG
ncbi:MAG: cytochrome P450 [Actinomadura sp.]